MKLRRFGSALAAVAFATVLAVAVPSTAHAATYTPPVTPIPDIPSRTIAMTKVGATWTDLKALEMWRAMADFVTKPGSTVATIPKPITPVATFSRGAAGGPLVAAFAGGFAIGQTGLSLYGTITGTDPLQSICGTGFEGVSKIMYLGMMPDCSSLVDEPNQDVVAGWGPVAFNGWSRSYAGVTSTPGFWPSFCFTGTGSTPPTGYEVQMPKYGAPGAWVSPGGTMWIAGGGSNDCIPLAGAGFYSTTSNVVSSPQIRIVRIGTGEVVAESEQTKADPVRTPSCKISWEDGTETVGTGRSYTESAGLPLSASGLGCEQAYVSKPGAGPELLPDRITVESEDDAGAKTTIADQDVPDMSPDQRKGLTSDNGKGLILEKTQDGDTQSCNTWAADCRDWWTKTTQGTQPDTDEGTYRCTFGGKVIDLAECGPYRKTFDEKTDKPTVTDPETGEQAPWTNENPGNSTNPGVPPSPGQICQSEWSSVANPVEWVLVPIKCALMWAFIPRPEVATQTQTAIADAWAPTIMGKLPGVVQSAVVIPDGGTGCSGPEVDIPIHLGDVDVSYQGFPLSACDEPMSTLASWARLIGSAVLIWATGLGIIRRASATVNAPGVGAGSS